MKIAVVNFYNKRVLITGGAGFIGSALVRRLLKEGYVVRVLDNYLRSTENRLQDIFQHIEFIEGDIRKYDVVSLACRDVQTVFHLAYLNGTEFFYSKPHLVLDIAIKGMINILDACHENKVSEFYLASSSEVYQHANQIPTPENAPLIVPDVFNPRFSYGGGKIACELMAIHSGKEIFNKCIIFRPHNVYGPNMGEEHVIPQFIRRLMKLSSDPKQDISLPIQGTGEETRAFIYIDDFIDGLMLLIEKGRNQEIYHIGSENEAPIHSVAYKIAKILKQSIHLAPSEKSRGSTPRRCPDISKMKMMGFNPKMTMDEGLSLTLPWYLTHDER
ncbi:MAG: SDR family NAD(P)-dependent oxidoreductase [Deltaproteobacteria bacterium]|nr:SDR family NAD(P)-dependent oxidoreductase [Deltaproteobacteria bacterium]